jgi:hypothetical protein
MTNWIYYPLSKKPPGFVHDVVAVFDSVSSQISSDSTNLASNEVLRHLLPGLEDLGFQVERGKRMEERIEVPVLFGAGGKPVKSFHADAYHRDYGCVIEVEAGRAVANNQFLKDLFQACMMHNVSHLVIAVRNVYRGNKDFERMDNWFQTLFASNRVTLPLEGIALIGY